MCIRDRFEGCSRLTDNGDLCVTLSTYISTFKFAFIVWLVTLVLGFAVAYFLAFHVQSPTWQTALFVLCTCLLYTSRCV